MLDTILGNEATAMDGFTELTVHCGEANDQKVIMAHIVMAEEV